MTTRLIWVIILFPDSLHVNPLIFLIFFCQRHKKHLCKNHPRHVYRHLRHRLHAPASCRASRHEFHKNPWNAESLHLHVHPIRSLEKLPPCYRPINDRNTVIPKLNIPYKKKKNSHRRRTPTQNLLHRLLFNKSIHRCRTVDVSNTNYVQNGMKLSHTILYWLYRLVKKKLNKIKKKHKNGWGRAMDCWLGSFLQAG